MLTMRRQFILLGIVFICASCASQKVKMQGQIFDMAVEVDKTCRDKTDTHGESFLSFMTVHKDIDRKFKCYIHCIMEEFKRLSGDGNFSLEESLLAQSAEKAGADHDADAVHPCKQITGPDECEVAHQMHKCWYESNTKLYAKVITSWYAKTKAPPGK